MGEQNAIPPTRPNPQKEKRLQFLLTKCPLNAAFSFDLFRLVVPMPLLPLLAWDFESTSGRQSGFEIALKCTSKGVTFSGLSATHLRIVKTAHFSTSRVGSRRDGDSVWFVQFWLKPLVSGRFIAWRLSATHRGESETRPWEIGLENLLLQNEHFAR